MFLPPVGPAALSSVDHPQHLHCTNMMCIYGVSCLYYLEIRSTSSLSRSCIVCLPVKLMQVGHTTIKPSSKPEMSGQLIYVG